MHTYVIEFDVTHVAVEDGKNIESTRKYSTIYHCDSAKDAHLEFLNEDADLVSLDGGEYTITKFYKVE